MTEKTVSEKTTTPKTVSENDIRGAVLRALVSVAPEAEEEELQDEVNFRDQIEIDSMDFVAFVFALEKELETKVPESDYPKLSSIQGCLAYFSA